MNLVSNQLILSTVQLRNSREQDALKRLEQTQQTCKQNYVIKNNIAVIKCIKLQEIKSQNEGKRQLSEQDIVKGLNETILLDPINYVGYYNLFNHCIRQKKYYQALNHLTQTISAIHLQRALAQKQQKVVNMVLKEYCLDSVLAYLIKSIIHVQHQKYVIAVSDINWVIENSLNVSDKIQCLNLIKIIFESLEQRDKMEEVQGRIRQLASQEGERSDGQLCQNDYRLCCTCEMSQSSQNMMQELSKRLKQFTNLIKNVQPYKKSSNTAQKQLIFKKTNLNDLNKTYLTKQFLFQQLKTSILESPLYTKSQSKQLSRSQKSQNISINESQKLIHSQRHQSTKGRKQQQHVNMRMSLSPRKDQHDTTDLLKLNTSLNNSGSKGKKKTQHIYPLERPNQEVEIKLVMAQLTNNKELLGQMDPYCIITYNGQKKQSSVVKGAGLQPRWKEGFIFTSSSQPSEVLIQVFDKQNYFKKDDFIGCGRVLVQKNGFIKVQLYQKEKQAGTIFITIQAKA